MLQFKLAPDETDRGETSRTDVVLELPWLLPELADEP